MDHIREYWENQGIIHKQSHCASWGDNWAISLEIETIGKYIHEKSNILDVGCANGYSTFQQLLSHDSCSIIGVDFAESMINEANTAKKNQGLGDNILFQQADIRSLPFESNSFDISYTTRVLINLPTWEEQKTAILECLRVVRPGGKLILSEGFWEPLVLLNSLRTLKGLPPLVEHDFNRYLKKSALEEFLAELEVDFLFDDFSSIYYLGSRFLRELVTNPSEFPGFSNPVNEIFYKLERDYSGGGFGIQQAVIITKPK